MDSGSFETDKVSYMYVAWTICVRSGIVSHDLAVCSLKSLVVYCVLSVACSDMLCRLCVVQKCKEIQLKHKVETDNKAITKLLKSRCTR